VNKHGKRRFRKLKWFLAVLLVLFGLIFIVVLMLLKNPEGYTRAEPIQNDHVSQYLTNILLPEIYNNAQLGEPFNIVVIQEGVNDIIVRSKWPKKSEGLTFLPPRVFFVTDNIVLMGTVLFRDTEFVVTIVGAPKIDEQGLLSIKVTKVKIGAIDITLIAGLIAKKIYQNSIAGKETEQNDLGTKIIASLLNNEPFEPVFDVENEKVRIENVTLTQKKLILRLAPLGH